MENYGGVRSRCYEFGGETITSTNVLTLGGILSIEQTPPDRIHDRTLLDLIRDDETCGKESSKKLWKLFTEKLRLKLVGSACRTTVPILASHVRITTDSNSNTTRNDTNRANSPPLTNTSSVPDTQIANLRIEPPVEENQRTGGEGGERETVKMSLMSLLEVDASAYSDDDDDDEKAEEAVAGGGDVGGGGRYKYSNCCVCMVRHKGAAFIPCGHTFCRLCSRELFVKRANCPLCNHVILEILNIF